MSTVTRKSDAAARTTTDKKGKTPEKALIKVGKTGKVTVTF